MREGTLALTERDRERLWVLKAKQAGRLRTKEASERLGVTRRHVRRLVRDLRRRGDRAIVHGLRGRQGNRVTARRVRAKVLQLQAKLYADYGPTLLAERLSERHGIELSPETLRLWLIAEGRWKRRRRRRGQHPWRERRARFGELIQHDTSIHDWFEGRGDKAVLVASIDDATGRMWGRFAGGDTVHANLEVIQGWVKRHGRPLALYVDRHMHFSVADEQGVPRSDTTQIGRALGELDIEMISARTPQAKGRIERAFRTLQDRLVKGLRERKVRTVEEANAYLEEEYWKDHNERFTHAPRDGHDAHRPVLAAQRRRLRAIFSVREERKVAVNMTIQYHGRRFLVETKSRVGLRVGDKVDIAEDARGGLRVLYKGRDIPFREVEVDGQNKPRKKTRRLPLAAQTPGRSWTPAKYHPWRQKGRFPSTDSRNAAVASTK
ncbi:MAG: ISNCY family transposase [Dehalococcoidia bacterium]